MIFRKLRLVSNGKSIPGPSRASSRVGVNLHLALTAFRFRAGGALESPPTARCSTPKMRRALVRVYIQVLTTGRRLLSRRMRSPATRKRLFDLPIRLDRLPLATPIINALRVRSAFRWGSKLYFQPIQCRKASRKAYI
eukprot:5472804-Pyramimonas_sp.AAC.1